MVKLGGGASEGSLQAVQGASWARRQPWGVWPDQPRSGRVLKHRDDAVHCVIVLVGGGLQMQVGYSSQRWWDDDGVAFGGGLILPLYFIN